jgi:histidyl-tRNA synthetase
MNTQRPRGTRDLSGEELSSIRHVMRAMDDLFRRYGYQEVETPIFEHLELFTKKSGSKIVDQLYVLRDKSGRELALRPELTAPVVRLYTQRFRSSPKPVKLFYFGSCFRYEEPQAQRWRQFLQAGVEVIGSSSPSADAEVAALASNLMGELHLQNSELQVGHIRLLRELLADAGVESDAQDAVLRAIDSGEEERIDEELKAAGVGASDEEVLRELISLRGGMEVVEEAGELLKKVPRAEAALKNLREIIKHLGLFGVKKFSVDLGIARGLDYYTDFVFEIYVGGVQVAGGGRYDNLVELLGGEPTPAVGVGFGVDRIAQAMLGLGLIAPKDRLHCMVLPADERSREEALKIVSELRSAGLSADTDLMGRSLAKTMEYANSIKVKRVVVVGARDMEKGEVVLRDMATGKQEKVSRAKLAEKLKLIS